MAGFFHFDRSQRPLVAVLRGVTPGEAVAVAACLGKAGIGLFEVTADSPDALQSLALIRGQLAPGQQVGLGTVLAAEMAAAASAAGADFVVSPHFDPAVVRAAVAANIPCYPGVMTPSEAFAALAAGASGLKLFPGDIMQPAGVKALRAVLPKACPLMVTGGVGVQTVAAFLAAGCTALGIGSALFAPGKSLGALAGDAEKLVQAYDQWVG